MDRELTFADAIALDFSLFWAASYGPTPRLVASLGKYRGYKAGKYSPYHNLDAHILTTRLNMSGGDRALNWVCAIEKFGGSSARR